MAKAMVIRDLVKVLVGLNQDLIVVIPGYEGGFRSPESVGEIYLALNVNPEWWYGPHERTSDGDDDAEYDPPLYSGAEKAWGVVIS